MWLPIRKLRLAISAWVVTEFAAALAMKVRTGKLTLEQRALVLAEWQRMRDASLTLLPIAEEAFETA